MKLALSALALLLLTACSGGSPTNIGNGDSGTPPADDSSAPPPSNDASTAVDTGPVGNPLCVDGYPKGPYGVGTGDVLDPTLSWQGYAANQTTVSSLTMSDLFDCDGSKGIDALIIDVSAGWCAACETQANDEAQLTAQYDSLNIKATTLLIMDAAEQPATTQTALDWRTTYKLTDVGIYADPNFLLQPNQTTIGLPITMVVNPRTMKVVLVTEGYASVHPLTPNAEAVSIAQQNHK